MPITAEVAMQMRSGPWLLERDDTASNRHVAGVCQLCVHQPLDREGEAEPELFANPTASAATNQCKMPSDSGLMVSDAYVADNKLHTIAAMRLHVTTSPDGLGVVMFNSAAVPSL